MWEPRFSPKILGIAGHVRSGKTHAAEYLGKRYNAKVFRNSKPIGDVIERIGGGSDRLMFANLGLAVLDVFGRDLIARHWIRIIERESPRSLFVVEGIRYDEELALYAQFPEFRLLGLRAPDTERYRRAGWAKDGHKDTGRSLEQFVELKTLPNEKQVDSIVERAEVIIENSGSIGEFEESIDAALRKIYPLRT